MPNTTGYSFGDVVLVSFPFTNQSGEKKRPAVVVSSAAYHQARQDLILMAYQPSAISG
ncbi:MAG: type II toxin-antitoxin system PemK/MazF family toxin [Gammaproteobacteria bacterium]